MPPVYLHTLMLINKWGSFYNERHLFKINSIQTSKWHNFKDEGHPFYIQPPWYANKNVATFYKLYTSYNNGMQTNRLQIFADEGHHF